MFKARHYGAAPIRNRIIEGQCCAVLQSMPESSADLVVTDPPYLVDYRDRTGRTVANDDSPESVLGSFPELYRALKPDSSYISFYGWNTIDLCMDACKSAAFKPVGHIVWHKDDASRASHLEARHEQAYLLAKGRPPRPAELLADVRDWEYTGNRWHPPIPVLRDSTPALSVQCLRGAASPRSPEA